MKKLLDCVQVMGCQMSGGIFEYVKKTNRYPCMLKQLICPNTNNKDDDTELNHVDPDPEFSITRNNGSLPGLDTSWAE